MLSEQQILELVRENERQKTALRAIRSLANNSIFGSWRQNVAEMCTQALGR